MFDFVQVFEGDGKDHRWDDFKFGNGYGYGYGNGNGNGYGNGDGNGDFKEKTPGLQE